MNKSNQKRKEKRKERKKKSILFLLVIDKQTIGACRKILEFLKRDWMDLWTFLGITIKPISLRALDRDKCTKGEEDIGRKQKNGKDGNEGKKKKEKEENRKKEEFYFFEFSRVTIKRFLLIV